MHRFPLEVAKSGNVWVLWIVQLANCTHHEISLETIRITRLSLFCPGHLDLQIPGLGLIIPDARLNFGVESNILVQTIVLGY
jgi:hypothetical protein